MKNTIYIVLIFVLSNLLFAQNTVKLNAQSELLIADIDQSYICPEWSPDGSKLAFTSFKYVGIWISTENGKDIQQVTDEAAVGFGFSWSSDSRTILARAAKFENNRRFNAIKLYNIETKASERLADYKTGYMGLPQWNGNAGEIAYIDEAEPRRITSKSGTEGADKFVYAKKDRIYVSQAQEKQNLQFQPIPGAEYLDIQLSPDESKVAFQQVGGNIYVLSLQNNKLIEIGPGHRPRWSADSRFITYMLTKDDGYNFTSSEIMISTNDGQTKYQLTETDDLLEMNPTWSPDGKQIVFDADGDIYTIKNMDEIIR